MNVVLEVWNYVSWNDCYTRKDGTDSTTAQVHNDRRRRCTMASISTNVHGIHASNRSLLKVVRTNGSCPLGSWRANASICVGEKGEYGAVLDELGKNFAPAQNEVYARYVVRCTVQQQKQQTQYNSKSMSRSTALSQVWSLNHETAILAANETKWWGIKSPLVRLTKGQGRHSSNGQPNTSEGDQVLSRARSHDDATQSIQRRYCKQWLARPGL